MAIYVLVPEVFGDGKWKDYPLWHAYAQRVWMGEPLYDGPEYLYPPTMVLLLAPFSMLPSAVFYALLVAISAATLWLSVRQSLMLADGSRPLPWWLAAVPIIMMLPQIIENFDLGQPHIILLAIMLGGFLCLRGGRPLLAGSLFALAAALKVFPISILPYLVWRRQWRAALSLVAVLAVILVVLPSPFRGYERNINELSQWFVAMRGDEDGFGQREEQNWSWKNQSIVALTHRLVRPVNYRAVDGDGTEAYMNVIAVDFRTANMILIGVIGVIGLAFIAVLLPRRRLDNDRLVEEWGILLCLMTIASPLARTYYFVWLLFPLTVLVQRAWDDERPAAKRWIGAGLAAVFTLTLMQLIDQAQAYGVNTIAAMLVAGMLAWYMHDQDRAA